MVHFRDVKGLGATTIITKDSASLGLTQGQHLVSLGESGSTPASTTLAVVASEREAKALGAALRSKAKEAGRTELDEIAPHDVTVIKTFSAGNRQLSNFCDWSELQKDAEPAGRSVDGIKIGDTFTGVQVGAVTDEGFVEMITADVTLVAFADGEPPDAAVVEFQHQGEAQKFRIPVAKLKAGRGRSAEPIPIELEEGDLPKEILDIIKQLPVSARLDEGTIDLLELQEIATALDEQHPPVPESAIESEGRVRERHALRCIAAVAAGWAKLVKIPAARTRAWPDASAEQLAAAMKKMISKSQPKTQLDLTKESEGETSKGGPYAQWPHVEAFAISASTQDVFGQFLLESADITAKEHKERVANDKSLKIACGALQRYLKAAEQQGIAEASITALASGAKEQDADDLFSTLLGIAERLQTLQQKGSGGAAGSSSSKPHPMQVNVHQPDTSGSEIERGARTLLARDASAIENDPDKLAEFNQLKQHAESGDMVALAVAMQSVKDTGLQRLLHSGEDVQKALAGNQALPPPVPPPAHARKQRARKPSEQRTRAKGRQPRAGHPRRRISPKQPSALRSAAKRATHPPPRQPSELELEPANRVAPPPRAGGQPSPPQAMRRQERRAASTLYPSQPIALR